jgi:hypothetical protein
VAALHEDLDGAELLGLVDLGADLLVGERPALVVLGAAIERAEAAVGDADVRVVDVPVDDVGDRVVRVLFAADASRARSAKRSCRNREDLSWRHPCVWIEWIDYYSERTCDSATTEQRNYGTATE